MRSPSHFCTATHIATASINLYSVRNQTDDSRILLGSRLLEIRIPTGWRVTIDPANPQLFRFDPQIISENVLPRTR